MSFHTHIRELLDLSKYLDDLSPTSFLNYKKLPFYTASGLPMEPATLPSNPLIFKTKFEDFPNVTWTTIFEYEGWFIETAKGGFIETAKGGFIPEPDTVSHYCPVLKWKKQISQYSLIADGVCPSCCEVVPEEVIGVWKLKNFNNIPSLSESKSVIAQNISLGNWEGS